MTPLLGSVTTQTAVDTQTVVQVNFLGQTRMAIRSQLVTNLAGGGTSLATTYRIISQDPVTHVIQLIGFIDQVGNNVVLNSSVLCPGGLDLGGVWDTITRIGSSVVTTTSSIIGAGDVSVDAGVFAGHHFTGLQIAIPGLGLGLLCSIDGWISESLGNIAKEKRIYLGLTSTKKIEVELQSTNVD